MAVFTKLQTHEINKILGNYNLGQLKKFHGIKQGVLLQGLALAVSFGVLMYGFLAHDFSVKYVADNSNLRAQPCHLTTFQADTKSTMDTPSLLHSMYISADICRYTCRYISGERKGERE